MAATAPKRKGRRGQRVAVDLLVPLSRAQEALRDQARRFLEREPPAGRARAAAEGGPTFDPELWRELAELEWLGILVPEEHGGAGGSVADACVVAEEIGRALLPGPYLATAALGAIALRGAPSLLRELSAGQLRVAVAPHATVAVTRGSEPRGAGHAERVLEADGADTIVLAASGEDGGAVLVRTTSADGLAVTVEPSLDATRHSCSILLEAVPLEILASGAAAEAALADVRTIGATVFASELAGAAGKCLEASVEYAKHRTQFGRPIGAYQSIKHRCVDVFMAIEASRTAVRHAARLADTDDPSRHVVAALARVQANRALVSAASCAIQVHGGAGFTWDNDAHLYLKRGKASEHVLGDAWQHQQSIARTLGI